MARLVHTMSFSLTPKELTGGPPRALGVSRLPLGGTMPKGGFMAVHMGYGFGADACMRMLADLQSPPRCSAPTCIRHLGRWPRAWRMHAHAPCAMALGLAIFRRVYGCAQRAARASPLQQASLLGSLASPSARTHPTGCMARTIKACTHLR